MMLFGLINASSNFMRLMNEILKPLFGKSIVVYFNDILIYNPTSDQHLEHLQKVFQLLYDNWLYLNLKK